MKKVGLKKKVALTLAVMGGNSFSTIIFNDFENNRAEASCIPVVAGNDGTLYYGSTQGSIWSCHGVIGKVATDKTITESIKKVGIEDEGNALKIKKIWTQKTLTPMAK